MPRSVEASRFKTVVVKATGLRTQVHKSFKNLGEMIEEIKEIEQAEDNNEEESDYFLNLWAQVEKEFKKVMENKSAHEDLVAKVRLMCGYMLEGYIEGTVATKVQGDAKEALNKIEKAEEGLDKDIKHFRLANRPYLMGRKKKQIPQVTERQTGAPVGISSQWILQMANKMEPDGTLKNDSRLTEMKAWKKQWKQYTTYLRSQGFPLDNKLYAEMLVTKCDVTMRLPLEAMDNLYQMGEDLLWEKIENIYKESNPIFMRRVKCYESKIMKGELLSEFATRLKLEYKESEMSKTTI